MGPAHKFKMQILRPCPGLVNGPRGAQESVFNKRSRRFGCRLNHAFLGGQSNLECRLAHLTPWFRCSATGWDEASVSDVSGGLLGLAYLKIPT